MGGCKSRNPLFTQRSCAQIGHNLPDHVIRELPLKTQHFRFRYTACHRPENFSISSAMYPFAVKQVRILTPGPSPHARMAFSRTLTSEGQSPHQDCRCVSAKRVLTLRDPHEFIKSFLIYQWVMILSTPGSISEIDRKSSSFARKIKKIAALHGTYPKTTHINTHAYLCVFKRHFVGIPQGLTRCLRLDLRDYTGRVRSRSGRNRRRYSTC